MTILTLKDNYLPLFYIKWPIYNTFDKMDYATIIKRRRKEIGITQEQLADVSGVSLSYLKMVESGKANPTITVLTTLLDCLGFKLVAQLKQPKL